jgi:hypothetical protein
VRQHRHPSLGTNGPVGGCWSPKIVYMPACSAFTLTYPSKVQLVCICAVRLLAYDLRPLSPQAAPSAATKSFSAIDSLQDARKRSLHYSTPICDNDAYPLLSLSPARRTRTSQQILLISSPWPTSTQQDATRNRGCFKMANAVGWKSSLTPLVTRQGRWPWALQHLMSS